jgi:hypothetical protein
MLAAEARRSGKALDWFTDDHHRVRDFVVAEIARTGTPLTTEEIAAGTGVPGPRAESVVQDLEDGKTFLFRSDGERVDWAYPVTAERTPHRIRLDSGERFFAA